MEELEHLDIECDANSVNISYKQRNLLDLDPFGY